MSIVDAESSVETEAPSYRMYAADVTGERLSRMLSHAEGVLTNEAIEPVHQMRVWARRTRASLELFEICYKKKPYQRIEREVKAAADALGASRDLDVSIENLRKREAALPPEERPGLNSFIESLTSQRDQLQHGVDKAISHLQQQDLNRKFQELADRYELPERESDLPEPSTHG